MTIFQVQELRRRWENAKRRRNGGKVTEADFAGLEDWEDFRDTNMTVGEAKRWLEYGRELREKFPGDEGLDDVVARLLEAERADQKIREFLESANERKRKANEFTDIFGNQRRSIWGDDPNAARAWDAPRTNAEPPRWTPERKVWG